MEFTKDPAEQTTAITDIILALAAFGGSLTLCWSLTDSSGWWKTAIWASAFGLMGIAAALGAVAHGVVLAQSRHNRIWRLLNMALALTVSLFAAGVVYDLWGRAAALKALPILLMAGLGFFAATLRYPGIFFIFIVYEGLALAFAMVAYGYLAFQGSLDGAALMAAGIAVSILAAGIQAVGSISIRVIWQFDHNGIYHIVQTAGLILLLMGLRESLLE